MPYKSVPPETLKQWLDQDEVILIDVRDPSEYASGHIMDAVSIPLSQVCITALPEYPNKKIVINCQRGMRGLAACQKLETELDKNTLYNLEGGISAWVEAGLPITGQQLPRMSLIQQAQLTIGIWTLISVTLALTVNPTLALLATIPGIGLIYAGLSGTCGLTYLMALMPWNKSYSQLD
ncbi:MAG: rhodanese-like domain-containing protein [Candidatus Paracaedibacteraceae bacterium]|nr:rhodanese-like domain-containing protein [Candidatus Paracaedibacteraceae bacterium]